MIDDNTSRRAKVKGRLHLSLKKGIIQIPMPMMQMMKVAIEPKREPIRFLINAMMSRASRDMSGVANCLHCCGYLEIFRERWAVS